MSIALSLSTLPELMSGCRSIAAAYRLAEQSDSNMDGWSLDDRSSAALEKWMPFIRWFYHHYFRAETSGWEQIPTEGPVMFVGSHNGGIASPDLHLMLYDWCLRYGTQAPLYGLMHPKVWQVSKSVSKMATAMGAIRAHPKMALSALNQGANIVVYPGGVQDVFRPYYQRHQIYFHNRKGFIKLALRKSVPIVPIISYGAHSTLIVLEDVYPQVQQLHDWGMPWLFDIDPETFPIYLGWPWGLALGPLPNIPFPQKIYTRVCPPVVFERTGPEAARDRTYVDICFHRVRRHMQTELNSLIRADS